jgi:hypothetical protein
MGPKPGLKPGASPAKKPSPSSLSGSVAVGGRVISSGAEVAKYIASTTPKLSKSPPSTSPSAPAPSGSVTLGGRVFSSGAEAAQFAISLTRSVSTTSREDGQAYSLVLSPVLQSAASLPSAADSVSAGEHAFVGQARWFRFWIPFRRGYVPYTTFFSLGACPCHRSRRVSCALVTRIVLRRPQRRCCVSCVVF